jgi:hypothetical protein
MFELSRAGMPEVYPKKRAVGAFLTLTALFFGIG